LGLLAVLLELIANRIVLSRRIPSHNLGHFYRLGGLFKHKSLDANLVSLSIILLSVPLPGIDDLLETLPRLLLNFAFAVNEPKLQSLSKENTHQKYEYNFLPEFQLRFLVGRGDPLDHVAHIGTVLHFLEHGRNFGVYLLVAAR
jgi:hypothetical protein